MIYIFMGLQNSGKTTSAINLSKKLNNTVLLLCDYIKYRNNKNIDDLNISTKYFVSDRLNYIEWLNEIKSKTKNYTNVIVDVPCYHVRGRDKILEEQEKIKNILTGANFVFVLNKEIIETERRQYLELSSEYLYTDINMICVTHCDTDVPERIKNLCLNRKINFINGSNGIKIL